MLEFKVKGQELIRLDNSKLATDSEQYLKARFIFDDTDWNGKVKTGLFHRKDGETYKAILDANNICTVPAEVLAKSENNKYARTQGSKIFVSLIGEYSTVRITTNEIIVDLNTSGYNEALTPKDPTETEYQQIVTQYENARSEMQEATEECQNAQERLDGVGNLFANAIKGNLSGAVVFTDDVSPVEHNPSVLLHGKNFFDVSKITNTDTATNNGDGSITISANTYYCRLNQKLREVCPQLKAGDTAVLSFNSDSPNTKYMYFHGLQGTWNVGHYLTITDEILDSYVAMYGFSDTSNGQECVISNIQIEKGTVATDYEPYIDPSTVTVRRCGKNLIDISAMCNDFLVENADGSYSFTMGEIAGERFSRRVPFYIPAEIPFYFSTDFVAHTVENETLYMILTHVDGTESYPGISFEEEKREITFNKAVTHIQFYLQASEVTGAYITFKNFQIEKGNESTDYEAYNGEDYIPASDGTVEGITSLSPNMTILTDTEGVIVECEYIKDTNVVVKKIADALGITI